MPAYSNYTTNTSYEQLCLFHYWNRTEAPMITTAQQESTMTVGGHKREDHFFLFVGSTMEGTGDSPMA